MCVRKERDKMNWRMIMAYLIRNNDSFDGSAAVLKDLQLSNLVSVEYLIMSTNTPSVLTLRGS